MELDKKMIENLIREVIKEEVGGKDAMNSRQMDPSGVIGIDAPNVKLEKFPFPIESDRVWLRDLTDLSEAPRMGAGLMEMENTKFEWTLTYDEYDYVIDGTLDILIDGRTVRATAGQVIYIPKNTKIQFSTPDKVRFFYTVFPANWADA